MALFNQGRLRSIVFIFVFGFLTPTISLPHQPEKIKNKLDSKLSSQITIHGILLWSSLGLLTPLGILVIRLSNGEGRSRRLKLIFYCHIVLQIISVSLAMTGAVLSVRSFDNSFGNYHQRIGLALYVAILLQPLVGFCRPHRGVQGRSTWYILHWSIGTGVCILGIINIYTGLHAYHKKTSEDVNLWTVLFTAEVIIMAFLYLLQDKWEYVKKQGVVLEDGLITTSHQVASNGNSLKDLMGL